VCRSLEAVKGYIDKNLEKLKYLPKWDSVKNSNGGVSKFVWMFVKARVFLSLLFCQFK
jgi:hypothetical protein